jgi:hypothetical protein
VAIVKIESESRSGRICDGRKVHQGNLLSRVGADKRCNYALALSANIFFAILITAVAHIALDYTGPQDKKYSDLRTYALILMKNLPFLNKLFYSQLSQHIQSMFMCIIF